MSKKSIIHCMFRFVTKAFEKRRENYAEKRGLQVAMSSPSVDTLTTEENCLLKFQFSPDLSLSAGPSVFLVLLCYPFSCCP